MSDKSGVDRAFEALYAELRDLAHRQVRRNANASLDTTALVHDVYVRFAGSGSVPVEDQRHFLAYCATAMRSVVVDMVRAQLADKRGAGAQGITLNTGIQEAAGSAGDEILKIHDSLSELAKVDPQLVQVVEMRYFAGLTHEEIAESTGMSDRTVRRHWQKALAFLRESLAEP